MGIERHFNLWNYFFRVLPLQGSCAEVAVLGGADIYLKSWHGVSRYFHLTVFESTGRWWKVWFHLRNHINVSLPMFTGNHPIPQPNWGYGVARRDLHRLQSLCELIQQLWQEGLMGVNLL
jgi:hypothetical protein